MQGRSFCGIYTFIRFRRANQLADLAIPSLWRTRDMQGRSLCALFGWAFLNGSFGVLIWGSCGPRIKFLIENDNSELPREVKLRMFLNAGFN